MKNELRIDDGVKLTMGDLQDYLAQFPRETPVDIDQGLGVYMSIEYGEAEFTCTDGTRYASWNRPTRSVDPAVKLQFNDGYFKVLVGDKDMFDEEDKNNGK